MLFIDRAFAFYAIRASLQNILKNANNKKSMATSILTFYHDEIAFIYMGVFVFAFIGLLSVSQFPGEPLITELGGALITLIAFLLSIFTTGLDVLKGRV
jgi:hypothetical protein